MRLPGAIGKVLSSLVQVRKKSAASLTALCLILQKFNYAIAVFWRSCLPSLNSSNVLLIKASRSSGVRLVVRP